MRCETTFRIGVWYSDWSTVAVSSHSYSFVSQQQRRQAKTTTTTVYLSRPSYTRYSGRNRQRQTTTAANKTSVCYLHYDYYNHDRVDVDLHCLDSCLIGSSDAGGSCSRGETMTRTTTTRMTTISSYSPFAALGSLPSWRGSFYSCCYYFPLVYGLLAAFLLGSLSMRIRLLFEVLSSLLML